MPSNLVDTLKSSKKQTRSAALRKLVASASLPGNQIDPISFNLHCHTSYSYNGYGHTPTSLAWLARQKSWWALGTVDFDVLDAVDETITACDLAGVRGTAGVETRVYLPEGSGVEFNSPGEPGVLYFVGVGFTSSNPALAATATFADMRDRAQARNRAMVSRLNAFLSPVSLSYDTDVLPLTPAGNATERHMLIAYDIAARKTFPDRNRLVTFWASKLGESEQRVNEIFGDEPFPQDLVRAKLMKRGGVGYVQPGPATFPRLDEVSHAFKACGAIPTYAYLNGSTDGERDLRGLLELLVAKGIGGITMIPDRNWNISDSSARASSLKRLQIAFDMSRSLSLPIVAGTEMNKAGQKLVDDLRVPALAPYVQDLQFGAAWLWGHTALQRAAGLGYQSAWAATHLPARKRRNTFYHEIGLEIKPADPRLAQFSRDLVESGPSAILDLFS